MSYFTKPARLTNGELYEGIQQFAGSGVMKSCNACGLHRASTEGWRRGICPDCLKHKAVLPASVHKAEKNATKAQGPWTEPGYSFQLPDWPPGFVSQSGAAKELTEA